MKRIFCIILTLCLLLCACAPAEAPSPSETTLPAETREPAQTVPPTEPVTGDYTIRIDDPETPIYGGPAFRYGVVAWVEEAGVYTIVEEAADMDGNLWGKLRSGAGWICRSETIQAPIFADYAAESFNAYHIYWTDWVENITSIGFTPTETLKNVEFGLLDWFETESWQMSQVLHTLDEMDPQHPFLAQVIFWGDMTTYGITFDDENGETRCYAISISGKDGSLICQEYIP